MCTSHFGAVAQRPRFFSALLMRLMIGPVLVQGQTKRRTLKHDEHPVDIIRTDLHGSMVAQVRTTHVTGTLTDIGSTLGRVAMIHLRKGANTCYLGGWAKFG